MAQCQVNQAQTIIINSGQNIPWTQDMTIGGDIYIEPTGVLTISATITMCEDARIIVKRGARLVIQGGGVLTGNPTWSGIEVWGNPSVGHPDVADVLSGVYPSSNYFQAINQHGVLIVENSGTTIENAQNAITTKRQQYDNNGQCCIETTGFHGGIVIGRDGARFINNRRTLEMLSYAPDNISFFDRCTFNFDVNAAPLLTFKAFITMWDVHGIEFTRNLFRVGSSVSGDSNSRGIFSIDADYTFTNANYFEQIPRSIVAHDATVTAGEIEISNNFFYSPNLGADEKQVEWVGVSNASYTGNYTNMNNSSTTISEDKVGFYMEGCTGYEVTNNEFLGSSNRNHNGIYVIESGSQGEIIFNNPTFWIAYGIIAEDNNGGLQIKCNDFLKTSRNNTYSWDNLGNPQGSCQTPIGPAGNKFSHPCIGSTTSFSDFHISDPSAVGNWTYYYGLGGSVEKVICQDGTIADFPCSVDSEESCDAFMQNNPCSSFPFCRVANINTAQSNISSIQFQMNQTPPNTPAYETLELELSSAINYKELLYNSLIREGLSLGQLLDIMPILEQDETHSLQKRRVELYLALKNYAKVNSELASLNRTAIEDDLFFQYYTVLNTLFSSGRTYFDLTSAEEAIVRNVASYGFGVSKKAQNILELVFGESFSQTLQFPSASSKHGDFNSVENVTNPLLVVYPNPVQNVLNIKLTEVLTSKATIHIVDIQGQILDSWTIEKGQTKLSLTQLAFVKL